MVRDGEFGLSFAVSEIKVENAAVVVALDLLPRGRFGARSFISSPRANDYSSPIAIAISIIDMAVVGKSQSMACEGCSDECDDCLSFHLCAVFAQI